MDSVKPKIWLFSKRIDLVFLFLPVWLTWVVSFLIPEKYIHQELSIWVWLLIVVGIDVSHVWSTIFRTYTDKEEFHHHRLLLIVAPIITFTVFFFLAAVSQAFFWTVLAYIALYHFIKQQYGFMRIYKAKGKDFGHKLIKDEWVVYLSMLYPVVYWHFSPSREFSWFVDGDFFNYFSFFAETDFSLLFLILSIIYWLIIVSWIIQEVLSSNFLLIGKVLWVLSTAVNWYLGIVHFNSDLVFTLTNVVAHGIPYLVLTFFYVEKKKVILSKRETKKTYFRPSTILFMISVVFLLAFSEEYLWDMWIYRDNTSFFEQIIPFSIAAFENKWLQAFGIALLTVPQATHYLIDGFIWKSGKRNPHLKPILMDE